jgi:hypothetical protein
LDDSPSTVIVFVNKESRTACQREALPGNRA